MCGAPEQGTIDRSGIANGATVIQGLVFNGDTPVGGGYVRLLDGGEDFTAEVITSATGQFRFFARPGSWTVRVIPGNGHQGGSAPVDVAEGEVKEIRITV
jgi:Protein of unknown function (DUF1416)